MACDAQHRSIDINGSGSCPREKLSQPDGVYDDKIARLAIWQLGKLVRLTAKRVFVLVGTQCDDQTAPRNDRLGAHARLQVDEELC